LNFELFTVTFDPIQIDKVRHNLVRDPAGITTDPRRIESF
jgi:hypothetical protein